MPQVITGALEESDYLILIASRAATAGQWVRDELEIWYGTLERADRLIIVLTDGEIASKSDSRQIFWEQTTALLQLLRSYLDFLPLWVDLRDASDNDWTLENLRFSGAVNVIRAR